MICIFSGEGYSQGESQGPWSKRREEGGDSISCLGLWRQLLLGDTWGVVRSVTGSVVIPGEVGLSDFSLGTGEVLCSCLASKNS